MQIDLQIQCNLRFKQILMGRESEGSWVLNRRCMFFSIILTSLKSVYLISEGVSQSNCHRASPAGALLGGL